jgi:tRNA pseudouridine55 synthase
MKGVILVDKPAGMTSHDVVDHIRKASGMRKVGHTGTLDPGATGLLLICLGAATRLSEHLTGLDKVYEGDMRLGVVTDSYDMDGKILAESDVPEIGMDHIQALFDEFTGDIFQVPPMVSAVKIGGERLYKKARQGEVIDRPAREVTVSEFPLLAYEPPLATFRVRCTSGTYVRALCHDIGERIGCGAVLDSLRRTAVGKHKIEDAVPLDDIQRPQDIKSRLLPLGSVLELPEVIVRPTGERVLATGGALRGCDLKSGCPVLEGWVQLKSVDGELLALAQVQHVPEPLLQPKRVFMSPK